MYHSAKWQWGPTRDFVPPFTMSWGQEFRHWTTSLGWELLTSAPLCSGKYPIPARLCSAHSSTAFLLLYPLDSAFPDPHTPSGSTFPLPLTSAFTLQRQTPFFPFSYLNFHGFCTNIFSQNLRISLLWWPVLIKDLLFIFLNSEEPSF